MTRASEPPTTTARRNPRTISTTVTSEWVANDGHAVAIRLRIALGAGSMYGGTSPAMEITSHTATRATEVAIGTATVDRQVSSLIASYALPERRAAPWSSGSYGGEPKTSGSPAFRASVAEGDRRRSPP